jgi:hypothetical protein
MAQDRPSHRRSTNATEGAVELNLPPRDRLEHTTFETVQNARPDILIAVLALFAALGFLVAIAR